MADQQKKDEQPVPGTPLPQPPALVGPPTGPPPVVLVQPTPGLDNGGYDWNWGQ